VQLAQERQTGRGLPRKQHQNDREIRRLHPPVERLVIFGHLPVAEPPLTHQENETCRIRDFLRELRGPETAGPQVRGREKYAASRVLAFDGGLDPFRQRMVR
jgi:hypothetical protein